MKKVIIALICIIILALGVIGFFVWQDSRPKPINVQPSGEDNITKGLAELTEVVPVTIKEEARGVNRIVNVTYPTIQSFSNKNFQKYVNDNITKVIFAYRDEINAIVDDETPASNLYTYNTSYEKYTHGDYLSLVILNDYQTGGIRSNKWKDTYNVNVRSERLLYLKDIFASNVDYEKEILAEIKKQAEKNHYVLMNGTGLEQLNDNQKFYIKDEKLIIYFDPAEIAPATYGELQFEMPFILEEGKFKVSI
ncbi:MAG: DUF3298 domain-containing protein [Clostridia bacterium]|nr:DUF3298 domain-containing protein [Clostridia bacterium]